MAAKSKRRSYVLYKGKRCPRVILPPIYREMDELPNPMPVERKAYGTVRYADKYAAVIEAEATVPYNNEIFDNYCLCDVLWTTLDDEPVQNMKDMLIIGDTVDFTFDICDTITPDRPLHCAAYAVTRQPEIYTLTRKKNVLGFEVELIRNYQIKVHPSWTKRDLQLLRDLRVPLCLSQHMLDEIYRQIGPDLI